MPEEDLNQQNPAQNSQPANEPIPAPTDTEQWQAPTQDQPASTVAPAEIEPASGSAAVASVPQADPIGQSQPAVQPKAAGGNSKKKFIIIGAAAAALALIFGGSALAYNVWYQNPQKVVTDSLINVLNSESVKANGTLTAASKDDANSLKVTFTGEGDQKEGAGTVDLDVKTDGKALKLKGEAVYVESGDLYIKIDGIKKALDLFLDGMPLPESYASLVSKVDDNWIMISADKLKDVNKEAGDTQECVTNTMKKLRNDKKAMDEIGDAYRNNQFIVIKEELGIKDGSLGYVLDTDSAKSKAFKKAAEKTKLYKELKACDKTNAIDDEDEGDSAEDKSDSKDDSRVELWVSQWSHEVTKLNLSTKSSDVDVKFSMSPKFNVPVTVKKPTKSMTVDELQKEVEALEQEFSQSYASPYATEPAARVSPAYQDNSIY